MTLLRRLSMSLMVLAVSAASVTMALARHQVRAVGEVELCTGFGMLALAVDAEGRPVGPRVHCAEYIATLVAVAPGGPALPLPPVEARLARLAWGAQAAPATAAPGFHRARAPPATS
jgi:hypothetical protein